MTTMRGEATTQEAPAARRPAGFSIALGVVAVALVVSGDRLLGIGGRGAISAGILVLVAALAAAAVAVGSRRYGPAVEGPLDLSARLGLGALGGLLAGAFHAILTSLAGSIGLTAALGSAVDVQLSAAEWGTRLLQGVSWGLVLGLVWRYLPGAEFVRKGLGFSLLFSAYVLLVRFPFFESAGFLGLGLGAATLVFVLLSNAIVCVVAAGIIAWGEHSPDRPVSAPLVP
jgi:hypothetical protein